MIDRADIKEFYENSSYPKHSTITVSGNPRITFTDENIIAESIQLKESLCTEEKLTFGCCEASELTFKILNDNGASLLDKRITFYIHTTNENNPIVMGDYFKIIEDKLSSDRKTRTIKAVDGLYDILNLDVTEWYNSLTYPMTLKAFRDAFFSYVQSKTFITQKQDVELVNDEMLVYKTIDSNIISGAMVIKAICEINGVFGKMSRLLTFPPARATFEYFSLTPITTGGALYPSETLYPSDTLYPGGVEDYYNEVKMFDESHYFSVDYANFVSGESGLDKLIIRQEENDIGVTVGSGQTFNNTYVVQGNFLTYGLSTEELTEVAQNLYDKIIFYPYTPLKLITRGNPCLELGDQIYVSANDKSFSSYILSRIYSGTQNAKDTYEAKGVENYAEEVNGLNAQINQLRGNTVKVKTDLEGLSVTVEDLADDVSAELELKVSKDDNDQVVSMINASADVITLNSNRLVVNSDNFKLTKEGNVTATGVFKSTNNNGWETAVEVNGYHVYNDNDVIGWFGFDAEGNYKGTNVMGRDYFEINSQYGGVMYNLYKATYHTDINGYNHKFSGTSLFAGAVTFDSAPIVDNNLQVNYNAKIKGSLNLYDSNSSAYRQLYANNGYVVFDSGLWASSLNITGTKNRVVNTEHYGARCLNAFETPYAQFGDNGSGTIGADGTCKIEFEKIFVETIDLSKGYQVSITQTSEKAIKWVEKKDNYFIVHGESGATFDWFVVARQKDYADVRLEEIDLPKVESEE